MGVPRVDPDGAHPITESIERCPPVYATTLRTLNTHQHRRSIPVRMLARTRGAITECAGKARYTLIRRDCWLKRRNPHKFTGFVRYVASLSDSRPSKVVGTPALAIRSGRITRCLALSCVRRTAVFSSDQNNGFTLPWGIPNKRLEFGNVTGALANNACYYDLDRTRAENDTEHSIPINYTI